MSDLEARFNNGSDVEDPENYLDKSNKLFAEAEFDDDGDGYIDVENLQKYLNETGYEVENYQDVAEGDMSDGEAIFNNASDIEDLENYLEEADKVFGGAELDDDGDGDIDVEDLQKYLNETGYDVEDFAESRDEDQKEIPDDTFSGNAEGDMELLSGENEEEKI